MNKRLATKALMAVAVLAASASYLNAQTQPTAIEPDTVLPVILNNDLSSKTAKAGDKFTATVELEEGDRYYNSLNGVVVSGVVTEAVPQNGKNPGVIDLDFKTMKLEGKNVAFVGYPYSLDSKVVERTVDGRLVAKPQEGEKVDRMKYVGYGAGAGLLLSMINSGDFEDALLKSALGAAIAYGIGSTQKSKPKVVDVELKSGSRMGLFVAERVALKPGMIAGTGGGYASNPEPVVKPNPVTPSQNQPAGVSVMYNGAEIKYDPKRPARIVNGVTMVPVASTVRALGFEFAATNNNQTIEIMSGLGASRINLGSKVAIINGTNRVLMDAPAQRLFDSMYVPAKFIALATGVGMEWDGPTKTVIYTGTGAQPVTEDSAM